MIDFKVKMRTKESA